MAKTKVMVPTSGMTRIRPQELQGWFERESWTVSEALQILHGFRPVERSLRKAEMRARYPVATECLENPSLAEELFRPDSNLGSDTQSRSTPTRWYEWAVKHEVPLSLMLRSEFPAWRHAKDERVHYMKVKKALSERIPDSSPEEIAMWLFDDELVAWTGKESDAVKFRHEWFPGWSFDYVAPMADLYFSRNQIEDFVPRERWLTYAQILNRWSSAMDEREARTVIGSRHAAGEIESHHPLGVVAGEHGGDFSHEGSPPSIVDCIFPLSQVKVIETELEICQAERPPVSDNRQLIAPPKSAKKVQPKAIEIAVDALVEKHGRLPSNDEVFNYIEQIRERCGYKGKTGNILRWTGYRGAEFTTTYRSCLNQIPKRRKLWEAANPSLCRNSDT